VKILVVEDSKFLRVAVERALARANYTVICASDGEEALRFAREALPDAILLDMLLPKLSGQEVLKALKKDPATAAIPVIVLTSLSQKNAKQLEKDGAAAYFEKSTLMLDKASESILAALKSVLPQPA